MKKIILLGLSLLFYCTAFSQSLFKNSYKDKPGILSNEVDQFGNRSIIGNSCSISNSDMEQIRFNIIGKNENSEKRLYLQMQVRTDYPIELEQNTPILIRFMDGSVKETKCLVDSKDEIGESFIIGFTSATVYSVGTLFPITEEVYSNISKGIKKIRFLLNGNVFDAEFKKDYFSKFLTSEYSMVNEALSEKADFYKDF